MNDKKIIQKLQRQYQGKKIICLPAKKPTEIICEIDPTEEHANYSIAISIFDKIAPHYHKITTEVYEVLQGKITVYKNGEAYILQKGDKLTINPGEVHYGIGHETWIRVESHPGWTKEDHILYPEVSQQHQLRHEYIKDI